MPHRVSLVLAAAISLAECGLFEPRVCTDIALAGLRVDVRDSITDAFVGNGARIVARSGAFADTVIIPPEDIYDAARPLLGERPGLCTVTVKREGYAPWSRSGVRITHDGCHVRQVSLVARLQR